MLDPVQANFFEGVCAAHTTCCMTATMPVQSLLVVPRQAAGALPVLVPLQHPHPGAQVLELLGGQQGHPAPSAHQDARIVPVYGCPAALPAQSQAESAWLLSCELWVRCRHAGSGHLCCLCGLLSPRCLQPCLAGCLGMHDALLLQEATPGCSVLGHGPLREEDAGAGLLIWLVGQVRECSIMVMLVLGIAAEVDFCTASCTLQSSVAVEACKCSSPRGCNACTDLGCTGYCAAAHWCSTGEAQVAWCLKALARKGESG